MLSEGTAGLPVEIDLAAGTYTLEGAPFAFDALTLASEVRLVSTAGATLQAATPNATIFAVSAGAPLITMRGLRLLNQLTVDGGKLHLENSSFVDSVADLGGALQVSGGVVEVEDSSFVGCSATRGGAVHVTGGDASFSGCTFKDCTSSEAQGGGALWVAATGSVVLRQASHL